MIQKDPGVEPQNNIEEMLCKLVKEQSAVEVDLEPFDGNPLEYTYLCKCSRNQSKRRLKILKVD